MFVVWKCNTRKSFFSNWVIDLLQSLPKFKDDIFIEIGEEMIRVKIILKKKKQNRRCDFLF